MATTPNKDPVPSNSPQNLKFNAEKLDEVINSQSLEYTDRLDVRRKTWAGLEKDNAEKIEETRQNLIPLSRQYMTLAAAQADIANIPLGSTTYVRSTDDSALAIEYINNAGALVATGRKMTSEAAIDRQVSAQAEVSKTIGDNIAGKVVSSNLVPLDWDSNGNVATWLERGDLGLRGMSSLSAKKVFASVGVPTEIKRLINSGVIPLEWDSAGNVATWLNNGALGFAKLDETAINYLESIISPAQVLPYANENAAWLYRSKVSKNNAGGSENIKILWTGHSWTEYKNIPTAMSGIMKTLHGDGGTGWIGMGNPANNYQDITTSYEDFDLLNVTYNTHEKNGIGFDGYARSTTLKTAVINVSGVSGDTIDVYYQDQNGVFDVSINGAAGISITGTGTNVPVKKTFTGLSGGTNILKITTAANSGTVTILGIHAKKSSGPGIVIEKCGHGNTTVREWLKLLNSIKYFAGDIKPDVILLCLATNEVNQNIPTDEYAAGLDTIISTWRTACPEASILLPYPCKTQPSGDFTGLRDATKAVAIKYGCGFISAYDYFPTDWNVSNANGLFVDNWHLSPAGADMFVRIILNKLLDRGV